VAGRVTRNENDSGGAVKVAGRRGYRGGRQAGGFEPYRKSEQHWPPACSGSGTKHGVKPPASQLH
jgi:hypothetical protein